MKKLIIVAHPHIQESMVNMRWTEELKKYPEEFDVHNIYEAYPDGNIDVEREQLLIEGYDAFVFQYPLYWFNCTPLLKKYMDEVFLYGWAYGSHGDKLKGKKFAIALSTGSEANDLQRDGKCHATLPDLLRPFELSALYCGMDYKGYFTLNGCYHVTPQQLDESARAYVEFLSRL
ncbi:MAG: NAD(P)H-dependent oxidoreductase [Paraprevotella sp.]|nr:NAD(P)H-dependent oxidoreductase [Paraprevotella sp.]